MNSPYRKPPPDGEDEPTLPSAHLWWRAPEPPLVPIWRALLDLLLLDDGPCDRG